MIKDRHLDTWVKLCKNVLFKGHAGVGKTQIVLNLWNKHNLNYRYFSGATMDPWVDLVGVPKQVVDPVTGESYIELITPRSLDAEHVEAIFIDELNRAPKKVQNALMELIQFKTCNGRSFPNLKFVWAAINPDEADGQHYNVYKMDNALVDRFHIHADIPFQCSLEYFRGVYGTHVAEIAIEWWNNIPMDKRLEGCSPRRLDYALELWQEGGDISFVLPEKSRPSDLIKALNSVSLLKEIDNIVEEGSEELEKFLRTKDNTFKVTNVFDKLSDKAKKMVVGAMPDEAIEANSNSSVFYRNSDFMERLRKLSPDSEHQTVEARDWKGVEDRIERLRQVATENGVETAASELTFCNNLNNEGHGVVALEGNCSSIASDEVIDALNICRTSGKFKSARSKAARLVQISNSIHLTQRRHVDKEGVNVRDVQMALANFHVQSDEESTRTNPRGYTNWSHRELMQASRSQNTSTRMGGLRRFAHAKGSVQTKVNLVESYEAINKICLPSRVTTIATHLNKNDRLGVANWFVASIALYGNTKMGTFENYSEVFSHIEINYPGVWSKLIQPNIGDMTFLPENILVDSRA